MHFKKIKAIVHNDLDGVVSYIVLAYYFGAENINVSFADYSSIDKVVSDSLDNSDEYSKIYLADISVKNEEIISRIEEFNSHSNCKIKLIDHHATALDLNKYSWANVSVELNGRLTCGAELVLEYCKQSGFKPYKKNTSNACLATGDSDSKKVTLDEFVELTRRYDTWEWNTKYNDTVAKELNDLLFLIGVTKFKTIFTSRIVGSDKFELFDIKDRTLLEQRQEEIDEYIKKMKTRIYPATIQGFSAGVVFAENFTSELGNKLAEMNPEYDFILIVKMSSGKMSLRTIKDDVDVSAIAKKFGGGGHVKASGASFDKKFINNFIQLAFCQD